MRVVFMGTPEFAVPALDALAADASRFEIVGVYTQPDRPVGRGLELKASPVKARALQLGIPVFQPDKLSQPGEYERLQSLRPEVIVVVAYGQILRRNVIELPRLGCVNIHSSLLPRWRGAAPIHWAVLAGDAESGVTTMRLVEKLDAGDILLQEKTPIGAHETSGELHDRLARMGAELIGPTLRGLDDGSLVGRVQDEALVTHARKLDKAMELLDPLTKSARELDRQVRGLTPWPGSSLMLQVGSETRRLKIKEAIPRSGVRLEPGTLDEKVGMLLLGTADGALELKRVQWEGKKEIDAGGFLNGLKGQRSGLPYRVAASGA